MLDELRDGTGLSRAVYLKEFKFPTNAGLGPSVRAGDFAEILVSDFVEFVEDYWCPRDRFSLKWNQNESTKGSDVVGFKFAKKKGYSAKDEMYVLESKTDMSGANANRLQTAVNDSAKDPVRHAASLNALKQRFIERTDYDAANRVKRFQDPTDNPYQFRQGAVLVCSSEAFDEDLLKTTVTAAHPNRDRLSLIVISGDALMDLVHALYDRAADEA
jgi:uncharacterized protein DUF1837